MSDDKERLDNLERRVDKLEGDRDDGVADRSLIKRLIRILVDMITSSEGQLTKGAAKIRSKLGGNDDQGGTDAK